MRVAELQKPLTLLCRRPKWPPGRLAGYPESAKLVEKELIDDR